MFKFMSVIALLSTVSFASAQEERWFDKDSFTKEDPKGESQEFYIEFFKGKGVITSENGVFEYEGKVTLQGTFGASAILRPKPSEGSFDCYWFEISSWIEEGSSSSDEIKITYVPNTDLTTSQAKLCAQGDHLEYARDLVSGIYKAD